VTLITEFFYSGASLGLGLMNHNISNNYDSLILINAPLYTKEITNLK
jgi:hypothetical protein